MATKKPNGYNTMLYKPGQDTSSKRTMEYRVGRDEPQRTNLQYGSQGNSTKNLQQMLNKNGANLKEDGLFGSKTQEAVKKYQQQNGLEVDGIVGDQTRESLFNKERYSHMNALGVGGSANLSDSKSDTTNSGFEYGDFKYDPYKESDSVTGAKQALDAHAANKPGAYQESEVVAAAKAALDAQMGQKPGEYKSQWQNQLNDTINKILNREEFSYDLNGDALYQQYKDKYIQQGKMAMADTMGQAAAMTGGYGSSYAASVGNQAYQQSLQQLNDVVPELYQMAYDRYNQEGQNLYNQYAMLGERENAEYGRHRDAMSDWQAERDYLTGRYDTERSIDYGMHRDAVSDYQADRDYLTGRYDTERNFDYSKYTGERDFQYGQYTDDRNLAYTDYRNQIGDKQWQATFDEGVRQYNEQFQYQQGRDKVADDQWDQTFQYQKDRDTVADQRYDTEWQHQLDREGVEDQRYSEQFQYQKDRDAVADSQWNKTFDEGVRQYNEQFQYQQDRDAVEDERYDTQWQHQLEREGIEDQRYDTQWQHQLEREGIEDQRYEESKNSTSQGSKEMWYSTGVQDDNGNLVFRNSDGKTMSFAPGVNPYTGTKHPDAKNGTFSNGYQPDNIGGTKLQNSGMTTNVTGKSQTIWEANGKYWLWQGDLNKYVEVDMEKDSSGESPSTGTKQNWISSKSVATWK